MRSASIVAGAAVVLAACGGGGDAATYGTCDRSALPAVAQCIEAWGPPGNIVAQEEGCAELGGAWSGQPCPDQDLIGCCAYALGLEPEWRFRECFYPRVDRPYDPEQLCTTTVFPGGPGVWTPGP